MCLHPTNENPLINAPSRTRTCDLRFRRPLLYPAELPEQCGHCTQRKVSCLSIVNVCYMLTIGPVAQRLELTTHNRSVPGSNPGRPIQYAFSNTTTWFFPSWHSHLACMHGRVDVYLYDLGRQSGNGWSGQLCTAIGLGYARSNSTATRW